MDKMNSKNKKKLIETLKSTWIFSTLMYHLGVIGLKLIMVSTWQWWEVLLPILFPLSCVISTLALGIIWSYCVKTPKW